MKPDFLFPATWQLEKKGSVSLSASGAKTDVQVSSAISLMKCKGAGIYELLNKTIFHSSNIPFLAPHKVFCSWRRWRRTDRRHD